MAARGVTPPLTRRAPRIARAQGVCIIVDKEPLFGNALIDELESARRGAETVYDACGPRADDEDDEDDDVLWTRRSYCILSECPDFARHYRFLRRILAELVASGVDLPAGFTWTDEVRAT